jgi:hypothetical protein
VAAAGGLATHSAPTSARSTAAVAILAIGNPWPASRRQSDNGQLDEILVNFMIKPEIR